MVGASTSATVSTKRGRIAKLAKEHPTMVLTNLAYHMDLEWLREAHRLTRKSGAPGIDGQTAEAYAADLDENLTDLLDRVKEGRYRAPPVRRVHIPKGKGETRPIGIPTFEDRILQRAVAMILEEVYEQEFLPCSYGFRRDLSAHNAIGWLREVLMRMQGGWVLEVDLRKFFDTLVHRCLREILAIRVRDKAITRLIGKWLNAGVMEDGAIAHPQAGTPQGGVISPLLANVYLHEVLDKWFFQDVRPRLKGQGHLLRYADDFVMVFEHERDARRVMEVLPKRLGKFGLQIHEGKTRLVDFRRPDWREEDPPSDPPRPRSFDLLGFNHHWAKSRRGNWVVKRKTSAKSFSRAVKAIALWCRRNWHLTLAEQHRALSRKLRGHCGYFGITGNSIALNRFRHRLRKVWRKLRGRTSQRGREAIKRFDRFLKANPLPGAIAYRSSLRLAVNG